MTRRIANFGADPAGLIAAGRLGGDGLAVVMPPAHTAQSYRHVGRLALSGIDSGSDFFLEGFERPLCGLNWRAGGGRTGPLNVAHARQ